MVSSDQAGTLSEPCDVPGMDKDGCERNQQSRMAMLAQNHFTMKNARKQLGEIAAIDAVLINPSPIVSDTPDALPLFENAIFHEKPRPRQPESPDTESFRSWLKASTPRHKASPALLERIRTIPEDEKA